MSLIEVLVAALVVGVNLAAMVSLWYFSYNVTAEDEDRMLAYNLARETMESIKETGFWNTPEVSASSPTVHYYDGTETLQDSNHSAARYTVSSSVVSSSYSSGTTPADNATRTVTITVALSANGQTLYTTGTFLVRYGI
jgi:Tfp pilus assembly protein PilV